MIVPKVSLPSTQLKTTCDPPPYPRNASLIIPPLVISVWTPRRSMLRPSTTPNCTTLVIPSTAKDPATPPIHYKRNISVLQRNSVEFLSHLVSVCHCVILGIALPNLAPDLRDYDVTEPTVPILPKITPSSLEASASEANNESLEPRKKKYAKEAWPGKRPAGSVLFVK